MEIQLCFDKLKWDYFVNNSPNGNVFCTTSFLDALGANYSLVTAVENGSIIIGAIILADQDRILKAPYPFTMYQGVMLFNGFSQMPLHKQSIWLIDHLSTFLDLIQLQYDRLSFCLSHTFLDLRGFQWFHYNEPNLGTFTFDLRYTGLLDLQSISDFQTYLTMLRSVRRQEYNKALKDGFYIESTENVEILNELHRSTFERQSIKRGDKEEILLKNISEAALAKKFGELMVCRSKNGIPVSASLFLFDHSFGYYLFGANNPDFRKTGAGAFLILENIRRCMNKRLKGVDFVGINSPKRGDFKTSFNAKPTPYFIVSWNRP